MKKIVLCVVLLFVTSLSVQQAYAVYQPTEAEVAFIKKVENQFRKRYKGKDIDGAVSEEIVSFMAKMDKELAKTTITPRMDWVFGTTKWFLLRIVERTFPWEVDETASTNASNTTNKKTSTKPVSSTSKETTATTKTPGYDGNYRLVDVDARKWTFMPAVLRVSQGEKVKLVVHDVDLKHNIFFPNLQVWKDGNGFYILDTQQAGTYKYYCAESCGSEYAKMEGSIIIED